MSQWTGTAQAYLDGGGEPTFFVAVHVTARHLTTGAPVPIGYWSGIDPIGLSIDGEARNYLPAGDAISVDPVRSEIGTNLRSDRVQMFGLGPEGRAIYRNNDVTQAPIDIHHICMDRGGVIIGTRILVRGVVDQASLQIPAEGEEGVLSLDVAGRMRAGTRVVQAKKSNQSYRLRSGDTALKYASLKQAEGDSWVES